MFKVNSTEKELVRAHWEAEACGVRYAAGDDAASFYQSLTEARYSLEPMILPFAQFEQFRGKQVLEIGVGAGTDFSQFLQAGAIVTGIDLTQSAVDHTRRRLVAKGYPENELDISRGDAENIDCLDQTFDLVYAWGVLHHSPNPERALAEAYRVLKRGGLLKIMIYHVRSWTALIMWIKYSLLTGKPWLSPKSAIFDQLESPGTKSYTVREARQLLTQVGFRQINVEPKLGPGDLLNIEPSQRHRGVLFRIIKATYPRWLVRFLGNRFGLYLLIDAKKP